MERVYNVPLKKGWIKASRYERAKRAIKFLKEFVKRHMKVVDVKISDKVNRFIWKRGARNPPRKITVIVKKEEDKAFVDLPEVGGNEVQSEGKVQNG